MKNVIRVLKERRGTELVEVSRGGYKYYGVVINGYLAAFSFKDMAYDLYKSVAGYTWVKVDESFEREEPNEG